MALPEFKNEDDFRQHWIKPFLTKLGYILVTHSHGPAEHGKDLYFADFDRFEHRRFYATQAKNGNVGTGTAELGKLLDQVKACFEVRIRDRKGAEDQRISAVYVMASGTISDAARTRITSYCQVVPYGENVYFLDGDRLETLGKYATFRNDQQVRSVLLAVQGETAWAIKQLADLEKKIQEPGWNIVFRLRMAAISQALSGLVPLGGSLTEALNNAWSLMEAVNQAIALSNIQPPNTRVEMTAHVGLVLAATQMCKDLRDCVASELTQLDQRYAMQIEIVDPG